MEQIDVLINETKKSIIVVKLSIVIVIIANIFIWSKIIKIYVGGE